MTFFIIFLFLFLIIRYILTKTNLYLEPFCSNSKNKGNACGVIKTSENNESISHTKKLMKTTKNDIDELLLNLSKNIEETKNMVDENSKIIKTNRINADKIKDAVTKKKKKK